MKDTALPEPGNKWNRTCHNVTRWKMALSVTDVKKAVEKTGCGRWWFICMNMVNKLPTENFRPPTGIVAPH